jgi:hypothetical protein
MIFIVKINYFIIYFNSIQWNANYGTYFCDMIKKVSIYGLAFGSLSASMLLIMYLNKLYLKHTLLSALPVIGNLVIFGAGVYFLIKSLMNEKTEKPITLGKALFASLLMGLLTAMINIAAYQHIVKNEKVIFGEYKNMQLQSIPVRVKAQFPEISVSEQQKKIAEYQKNFEENLTVESFSMVEIQMFFSVALVVTLLVYIANQKKQ